MISVEALKKNFGSAVDGAKQFLTSNKQEGLIIREWRLAVVSCPDQLFRVTFDFLIHDTIEYNTTATVSIECPRISQG